MVATPPWKFGSISSKKNKIKEPEQIALNTQDRVYGCNPIISKVMHTTLSHGACTWNACKAPQRPELPASSFDFRPTIRVMDIQSWSPFNTLHWKRSPWSESETAIRTVSFINKTGTETVQFLKKWRRRRSRRRIRRRSTSSCWAATPFQPSA